MTNAQDPKWVADGLAFWGCLAVLAKGKDRRHAKEQLAMFETWARQLGLKE